MYSSRGAGFMLLSSFTGVEGTPGVFPTFRMAGMRRLLVCDGGLLHGARVALGRAFCRMRPGCSAGSFDRDVAPCAGSSTCPLLGKPRRGAERSFGLAGRTLAGVAADH